MKTILIFLEKYLLFIPRAGSILIDDLLYIMQRSSLRERKALEQRDIINMIRTLDTTNGDGKIAFYKAIEGNNKEVIFALIQHIHKYCK